MKKDKTNVPWWVLGLVFAAALLVGKLVFYGVEAGIAYLCQ